MNVRESYARALEQGTLAEDRHRATKMHTTTLLSSIDRHGLTVNASESRVVHGRLRTEWPVY